MYLKRKSFAFNSDNPGMMEDNRKVFESALKTADATFQNLDSSEISLTDVSHYFDSDPTKVVATLRVMVNNQLLILRIRRLPMLRYGLYLRRCVWMREQKC